MCLWLAFVVFCTVFCDSVLIGYYYFDANSQCFLDEGSQQNLTYLNATYYIFF